MRRALFVVLLLTCSALARADASPEGMCGKLPIAPPKRENQPSFRLACEQAADGNAQDGRWGKALFDHLGNPVFSPDGKRIGYRAKQGNRWFIMVNDQRGPEFDRVSSPVFSPDGRQVAYWARQDKKEFIVLDDKPGPVFDGAGFPVFGPDNGKVAYRARQGRQWFVMRSDQPSPAFDDIGHYTAPARGSDSADLVFSPDGLQLAYAARRGEQWFIVREGRPGPVFEHVGLPVFGPDGRLAHRARQNDREFIVLGEQKGPEFDFVSNPVFSPDGRDVAYWARQGKTEFVMRGDRKGPVFESLNRVGAPVFNRDGSQVIYWAKRGEKEFILSGEQKGPEFDAIEAPVFNRRTDQIAYRARQGDKEWVMLGNQKGPEFDFDHSSRNRLLAFSPDGHPLAYRVKQEGKEFILFGENKGPAFDEVGDPVLSPNGGRLAYRAKTGERWFMLTTDPEGRESPVPVGIQPNLSPVLPLIKGVPTLIPHPVIAGVVLGGSARGRWVKIDNGNLPEANPSACSSETGQCCRTLGPEWMPSGLLYKLYSFDELLGECPGGQAKACDNMATGDIDLTVDFAACPIKKFSLAIAGPWNALPRRPKVLKNHQDFVPVVRNVLDRKGLQRAPVRIEYVHGVDLDGDGTEERVIHARSRKGVGDHGDPNDYSLLLLVRTVQGKPETTAISAWWPGEQENQGPYESYDSSYADANGDGVMEIFVDWRYYEGSGIRVYALRDGKPVETELGYFNGL
jgi:Tol biopolymer transport system component